MNRPDLKSCWDSLSQIEISCIGPCSVRSYCVNGDIVEYALRRLAYDCVAEIEAASDGDRCRRSVMFIMAAVESISLFSFENGLALCMGLLTLHPSIWNGLVKSVMECYTFDEKELFSMRKDFALVYSNKDSVKLSDRRVGRYLTLCAFWEKLGMNMFDLQRLPYKDYIELSHCIKLDSDAKNRERKRAESEARTKANTARGRR